MANRFYDLGSQKSMSGDIDWVNDDIRAILVSSVYTPDFAVHEFVDDLSGVLSASPIALTSKVFVGRAYDAADITFPTIAAANTAQAVILVKWTGVESTSPLLIYLSTILGFPFTTNGGNVPCQWFNGSDRIWSLP